MQLFAISYESDAIDQKSGDGWFSGWFKIFVINKRHSNAEFWSTWCEDCFKKKNQSGGIKRPKAGRFLSRKTDCLRDLWKLPGHRSQRFCRELCRRNSLLVFDMMIFKDSIQSGTEFLISMTKIPHDDISERLYKIKVRVWEIKKQCWTCMTWKLYQKKVGPDYHRLKTMVKRSIEQEIQNKNFGARNGNYEKNSGQESRDTTTCTKNSWT